MLGVYMEAGVGVYVEVGVGVYTETVGVGVYM